MPQSSISGDDCPARRAGARLIEQRDIRQMSADAVLIVGRLPAAGAPSLKGQHRVTLNIARHLPGPKRVVTLVKQGGILSRCFKVEGNSRQLQGVAFEELSVFGLLRALVVHRRVLVTAGYYYGLLACAVRLLTLGRVQVAHRTGGFVRLERQISDGLGEEQGNGPREVLMEYLVLRLANRIIVNSEYYRARLHSIYPFTRAKTVVMPNGLDDALVPAGVGVGADPGGPVRLLSVTNLFGKKGVDVLLEAFRHVQVARPLILTIVGDGLESMKQRIARVAADPVLVSQGKQILFLTRLGNEALMEQYRLADLYVQLSRLDEGPSAVLEAYAHGLPLLISDQVGTHECILKSGLCQVCPADPDQAATHLASMIESLGSRSRALPDLRPLRWADILSRTAPAFFA